MDDRGAFERVYRYAGVLSPLIAFLSITLAVLTHPWFSFEKNAISDLGKIGLEGNYILNTGLIVSGSMGFVFGYGLLRAQKRTLGKIGCFIFILGIVSLILIGTFPEGTSPHYPASLGFFLLSSLGMLIKGIDDLREKGKSRKFGFFSILLFLIGWILATIALKSFEGVAIPELIGAVAFSVWVYGIAFWRGFE